MALFIVLLAHAALAQNPQADLLRKVGIDQRLNQPLPLDLVFQDEHGRDVRLGEYFGERPVILYLGYYECPMLCTVALNGLVKSLRALPLDVGKDFNIVTVSIDPEEKPALAAAKKAQYLENYGRAGAANGWHFLTGRAESIAKLSEAVGFRFAYDPQKGEYAHGAAIMVATPQGKLARYFYGVEYPPRDLRLGLVEASAGKVGTPVDRIMLFCYRYDPTTGKYGMVILRVLRAAGIATVLALAAFMAVMFRRDRKPAKA